MKSVLKSKKGAFGELWRAAIGIGIFVLVTSLVALMLAEVQDQTTDNTVANNVTDKGLEAVDLLADWQTIVVIAIIMIVLIGLILRQFGYIG